MFFDARFRTSCSQGVFGVHVYNHILNDSTNRNNCKFDTRDAKKSY